MNSGITIFVEAVLYLMLAAGIVLVVIKKKGGHQAVFKGGVRRLFRSGSGRSTRLKPLEEMFLTVTGRDAGGMWIVGFCAVVGLSVMVPALYVFSPVKSVLAGCIIGVLPLAILKILYDNARIKSSFEGEPLITAFLAAYRIKQFNASEAVEQVVRENTELKYSNQFLYRFLAEIRSSNSEEEILAAADRLGHSFDTSWGRMFASNLGIGCSEGSDVSRGIEEVLVQLREAKILREERKRLNSESSRMTLFLIPATYLITVVMTVRFAGLTFGEYLENQFMTDKGLTMFLAIIGMFLINIILTNEVTGQKFDI